MNFMINLVVHKYKRNRVGMINMASAITREIFQEDMKRTLKQQAQEFKTLTPATIDGLNEVQFIELKKLVGDVTVAQKVYAKHITHITKHFDKFTEEQLMELQDLATQLADMYKKRLVTLINKASSFSPPVV